MSDESTAEKTYVAEHVIVEHSDDVSHEVLTTSANGNFITVCQRMRHPDEVTVHSNHQVNCQGCRATHEPPPVLPPPTPRPSRRAPHVRPRTGRPQWRVSKTASQSASETLKFAHKAIVAAIEWHNRGGEGQFRESMLDQAALAHRFLGELLTDNGRDTNPPDLDDDD